MTVAAPARPAPRYHAVFPAWEGTRPVSWFFAEQLLEARAESDFPTNSAGGDEDVNVYLVGLLTSWALVDGRAGLVGGADPLLLPPDADLPLTERADRYRRQADHRLLALGLCDRGDLVRRRTVGWRMTAADTRARDLAVVACGYELAANLVDRRRGDHAARVAVWRKLARHAPRYVHVLQSLARRRLGLGARLDDGALARLMASAG